jgi:quinoprotein glucose dehydrogenase
MPRVRVPVLLAPLALLVIAAASAARGPAYAAALPGSPLQTRNGTSAGADDWTTYGGDLASRRYRPYTQITGDNFKNLEIAWRFKADALGPRPEFNFQATPLVINGVLYTPFGTRRDVVALDAATGEMLWMHREDEGKRGDAAPRKLSGRGVAYWTDGRDSRNVYVTPGYHLVALDAKTGLRVESCLL